jgi:copper chaperone CopZ
MNKLKVLSIAFCLFFASTIFAQVEKVVIKTSAQCEMCKETLETAMASLEGVKNSKLDIETKELTVKYNTGDVSIDKIRKAIATEGYWADKVMPEREAYANLPDCCKPKKSCCASGAKKSCSSGDSASGEKKACCAADAKSSGKKDNHEGHGHEGHNH